MKKKAKELKTGDVVLSLTPSQSMGWEMTTEAKTITVSKVKKEMSSGGCRVIVFAEGLDKPYACLRGSTTVSVL